MNNWRSTMVFFGKRKENTTVRFSFYGTENLPEIKEFIGSCGCTNFNFNKETKGLTVKLNFNTIPPQVAGNVQDIHKTITVYYMNDTSEVLHIKGIITK